MQAQMWLSGKRANPDTDGWTRLGWRLDTSITSPLLHYVIESDNLPLSHQVGLATPASAAVCCASGCRDNKDSRHDSGMTHRTGVTCGMVVLRFCRNTCGCA